MVSGFSRREHKVGVIDLGLDGPTGFPDHELGFAVRWWAAPTGVRKAIRASPIAGVVVQLEAKSIDSAASIIRSVARENKNLSVWLSVSSGGVIVLAKVVTAIRLDTGSIESVQVLTPRELEVLTGIRAGSTNQAIASGLGVSLSTVKRHVEHILLKLAAKNRAEAAARLRRQNS
jgi:DNA-binding CsgD family transcriptional regulator